MVRGEVNGIEKPLGDPMMTQWDDKSDIETVCPYLKSKTLTIENTNPCILCFKQMEYAAKGPVICRAMEIEQELRQGKQKPFSEVIKANIGDAHAMGQKPITFIRQVLALVACPDLIHSSNLPEDVKKRAQDILKGCRGGSAGSYTDSRGIEIIRRNVANYIEKRDGGIPSSSDDVILVAGASEGIRACLKLFKGSDDGGKKSGVMTPVPQYPLYAATLGEYDMCQIDYYLNESQGWALDMIELERAISEARKICHPRAIVIINPGNPTGNVLPRQNMEDIIKFAHKENLFILADEVYQDNIYEGSEFLSFKKVMVEMGSPYNSMELMSFFSCSKGFACECGLRGGYIELFNMDADVKAILLSSVAAKLCPSVLGQSAVDCVVNPPKPSDPSFDRFDTEKKAILADLAEKADFVQKSFAEIPGIECQPIQGAMYAFPSIHIPIKAIEAAREKQIEPDVFYALELLESMGISVVPGTGVGQVQGTYHFRTTLLPSLEKLKIMMTKFHEFHVNFLKKYS